MLIVHLFLSYAHVNPCHFFSSSLCRGLAAATACGSSWTFLFTFLLTIVTFKTLKSICSGCRSLGKSFNGFQVPFQGGTSVVVPYCSCCLCLYFGSSIMLVTYCVNFR